MAKSKHNATYRLTKKVIAKSRFECNQSKQNQQKVTKDEEFKQTWEPAQISWMVMWSKKSTIYLLSFTKHSKKVALK